MKTAKRKYSIPLMLVIVGICALATGLAIGITRHENVFTTWGVIALLCCLFVAGNYEPQNNESKDA